MIYGFDTKNRSRAIACLVIYAVYRSRNMDSFPISTKMWDQITNFSKLAAKKSANLAEFIEIFKKPMRCDALKPRYCATGFNKAIIKLENGAFVESGEEGREFLTSILENSNEKLVLNTITNETSFLIMLVRERIENEKLLKRISEKNKC
jgi:hypothetical protein